MPGSHTYVSRDSTKHKCVKFRRVFKRKSTLMIFERHANLKYKYGNRHFWCRGYYVDTVGKNAKKIQEYIQNQLKEDLEYDQMTLKEYIDPFTGEPVKTNR
ncbi:transposase [Roseburia inulinivorans]|nr:transposase [Roseburia inulinivorans]